MNPLHQHPDSTQTGKLTQLAQDSSSLTTAVSVPRKPSIARILQWLPPNASEAQKDSAIRTIYPIQTPSFSTDTTVYNIPAIGAGQTKVNVVDRTFRDNFFSTNSWSHPEIPYHAKGIAGDPPPYRFRTDSYVTIIILLSFFLTTLIITRTHRYLGLRIKDFFYTHKQTPGGSNMTNNDQGGTTFFVVQTCFVLGILFFDYTQNQLPSVFNQISPYMLLILDICIFLLYYTLKLALYKIINWVFFPTLQNHLWQQSVVLTVWGLGVILFPLALLVIYFDLAYEVMRGCVLTCLGVFTLLRLYKVYNTFFTYRFGYLHLILYFCTVEIAPLFLLWSALIYSNKYLITNF